ncbi:hypothetical protein KVR01_004654 [Diaporthe batatas]|uniref:uncharacterized protein n=1 Tax=Diaporthe batatas TaxID=748121 RepID=UPI001D04354C|nr:uncharacterized protein KVR01_004654 [Diaporthe batatas]KAG8166102.1 hypothetical protein KVR01_004654 [Diaporthe batatas]
MDRILLAPEPLIRAVLVALCDNQRLQARSIGYLDRLEKLHRPPPPPGDAPATGQPQPASLKLLGKRKAPEPPPPQICIQCKHAFLPETNNQQACAFHHGRLDIDPTHRTWAAGEGAEHASQKKLRQHDTEDSREDNPEGFLWSCCGRSGAGPGCTEGEHLAIRADDRSKRARYAADPDELRMFEGKVLRPNEFVNDYLVDDSSDSEAWSAGAASRGVESQAVEAGGAAADEVPSEATERNSEGRSSRSDVGV